jgi:hypothetical protein
MPLIHTHHTKAENDNEKRRRVAFAWIINSMISRTFFILLLLFHYTLFFFLRIGTFPDGQFTTADAQAVRFLEG